MSTLLLFDFHSDRKYGKYSRKGKIVGIFDEGRKKEERNSRMFIYMAVIQTSSKNGRLRYYNINRILMICVDLCYNYY